MVKNKLFKLISMLSITIAVIVLFGSVIVGLNSITCFFHTVNKNIKIKPLTSNEFIDNKIQNKKATTTKVNTKSDLKNKKYQIDAIKYYSDIIKSVDSFAIITNQDTINGKALEHYLVNNTQGTTRKEYLNYLASLSNDLKQLDLKAKEISLLKPTDPKYIAWPDFLSWHIKSYMQKFNQEKNRIYSEQVKNHEKKSKGKLLLIITGILFGLFVLFSIIAILVQIEFNTRHINTELK